jgi:hypothetical protein
MCSSKLLVDFHRTTWCIYQDSTLQKHALRTSNPTKFTADRLDHCWLLSTKQKNTSKYVWSVKLILTKSALYVWAPCAHTTIFLMIAITYTVLFRDMVTLNYLNVIKIINSYLKKAILLFGVHLKDPYFWNMNLHIHKALTYDG